MKSAAGFTLVELIVVLVILSLLGAYAISSYVNLQTEARIALLKTLKGQAMSVAQLVKTRAYLEGKASLSNSSISLNGMTVLISYGFPRTNQMFYRNASNPGLVDVNIEGATITGGSIVRLDGNNNCRVRYRSATAVGNLPQIDTIETGC